MSSQDRNKPVQEKESHRRSSLIKHWEPSQRLRNRLRNRLCNCNLNLNGHNNIYLNHLNFYLPYVRHSNSIYIPLNVFRHGNILHTLVPIPSSQQQSPYPSSQQQSPYPRHNNSFHTPRHNNSFHTLVTTTVSIPLVTTTVSIPLVTTSPYPRHNNSLHTLVTTTVSIPLVTTTASYPSYSSQHLQHPSTQLLSDEEIGLYYYNIRTLCHDAPEHLHDQIEQMIHRGKRSSEERSRTSTSSTPIMTTPTLTRTDSMDTLEEIPLITQSSTSTSSLGIAIPSVTSSTLPRMNPMDDMEEELLSSAYSCQNSISRIEDIQHRFALMQIS
ncbi:unnamed protein product [Rhizophagus irregularis]|nr:unnamed protein product [Rhizophagus irregularis]